MLFVDARTCKDSRRVGLGHCQSNVEYGTHALDIFSDYELSTHI